jgi:acetyltransferase-like isoleucine patch superfamily enzyme
VICIDPTARISALADIEDSVRGSKIIIGARTVLDSFVKIKPAGGTGDLEIGEDCVINSGCVMYTGNGVRIGNGVAVASNCTFASANHEYRQKDVTIRKQGFRPGRGGILVEDDVWIGANCVLLDGAILRRGCVLGAGSIVRGELKAYGVYAGSPVRLISERT